MSDNIPYVVKQVLRLYNLDTVSFVNDKNNGYISITVHVIFSPKIKNSITPKNVRCYGVVNYYKKGRKLEELMHISGREMPILDYIDDMPSFYSFVEKKIIESADIKYNRLYG